METRIDDAFVFATEPTEALADTTENTHIQILSVEDNLHYQEALLLGLRSLVVEGCTLDILTAASATEAADVIARNPDISVILLDVVMEEDDAGLHLVDTIRKVLGNSLVRIILLTGQPGFAPRRDVMRDYDINEYWQKSDLDAEKLRGVIISNIRAWNTLRELETAREGLELLIAATRTLSTKSDLKQFCRALLEEISNIIGTTKGGIICSRSSDVPPFSPGQIIAASGSFHTYAGEPETEVIPVFDDELQQLITHACETRLHQFSGRYSVLYFDTQSANNGFYIMAVESDTKLSNYAINLLQAFSENVSSGFNNVALLNRVTRLAYRDPDLDIPNRTHLIRELSNMTRAEFKNCQLITIEIQNFSELMLLAGNTLTLSLIREIKQRLQKHFPEHQLLARTSKDAFSLLFSMQHPPEEPELAQLSGLQLCVDGLEIHAQLHVVHLDLAQINHQELDRALPLIEAALTICRIEKQTALVIQPALTESIVRRYKLLQELNQALRNDQLFIALQPQVTMQEGKLAGFEALVRWQKDDGEWVSPAEFIPAAETSGLITKIDLMVLRKTLSAISTLHQAGYSFPCSCNITNADLTSPRFVAELFELIDNLDFPAHLLGFEITETQAMSGYERINPILKKLINRGVEIYIDDFGTGYSSLAHITRLAATHLKIDQEFIAAMETGSTGEHVVDMVIRLGQRFDFGIVAEGIETEAQRTMLLEKGCKIAQGFLFARPMPLETLLPWLKTHHPLKGKG